MNTRKWLSLLLALVLILTLPAAVADGTDPIVGLWKMDDADLRSLMSELGFSGDALDEAMLSCSYMFDFRADGTLDHIVNTPFGNSTIPYTWSYVQPGTIVYKSEEESVRVQIEISGDQMLMYDDGITVSCHRVLSDAEQSADEEQPAVPAQDGPLTGVWVLDPESVLVLMGYSDDPDAADYAYLLGMTWEFRDDGEFVVIVTILGQSETVYGSWYYMGDDAVCYCLEGEENYLYYTVNGDLLALDNGTDTLYMTRAGAEYPEAEPAAEETPAEEEPAQDIIPAGDPDIDLFYGIWEMDDSSVIVLLDANNYAGDYTEILSGISYTYEFRQDGSMIEKLVLNADEITELFTFEFTGVNGQIVCTDKNGDRTLIEYVLNGNDALTMTDSGGSFTFHRLGTAPAALPDVVPDIIGLWYMDSDSFADLYAYNNNFAANDSLRAEVVAAGVISTDEYCLDGTYYETVSVYGESSVEEGTWEFGADGQIIYSINGSTYVFDYRLEDGILYITWEGLGCELIYRRYPSAGEYTAPAEEKTIVGKWMMDDESFVSLIAHNNSTQPNDALRAQIASAGAYSFDEYFEDGSYRETIVVNGENQVNNGTWTYGKGDDITYVVDGNSYAFDYRLEGDTLYITWDGLGCELIYRRVTE